MLRKIMHPLRDKMKALTFGLLLTCSVSRADVFVRDDINTDPEPKLMTVCHGNGCPNLDYVTLTPDQWQEVRLIFHPMPRSAAEERERLGRAIAQMEKIVGAATGTSNDKGGTFNGGIGQMDCIDESINTTLYLTMFQKFGLMREHRVEDRATRGWFIGGWPHTTAVVRERSSNRPWAVDSWFMDNGEPPSILPLETWESGWEPIR